MKNDTSLEEFSQATIQRSAHDKENPYVMVSHELIRDESISPECRWMLIYLLSNKEGWRIRVAQIAKHVGRHMSKKTVYALFNKAIEAGYIKREYQKSGNLRQSVIYHLSERPIFKECFRLSQFGDVEPRDVENGHHKKEQESIYPKSILDKKEHVSDLSVELTTLFIEKLKEMNPKIREPNLKSWEKEMRRIMTVDNRTQEEIKDVINFIVEQHNNPKKEFTWSKAVISPEKLRKHFASIWMEMNTKTPTQKKEVIDNEKIKRIKENKKWAEETAKKLQKNGIDPFCFVVLSDSVTVRSRKRNLEYTILYEEIAFSKTVENILRTLGAL